MGVVYSVDQVKSGRVPSERNLYIAAERIVKVLSGSGAVRSLVVHGSVAVNRATTRSDLDIYIVPETRKAEPFVTRSLQQLVADYNIRVEPIAVPAEEDIEEVRAQLKGDMLFATHLGSSYANSPYSFGEPDPRLQEATLAINAPGAAREILVEYCVGKRSRFNTALANISPQGEPDHTTLQRAFELPGSVSRKTAQFLSAMGVPIDYEGEKVDEFFAAAIKRGILEDGLPRVLEGLREDDRAYSRILADTLNGSLSPTGYSHKVSEIYQPTISRAQKASMWLADMFKGLDLQEIDRKA